LRKNKKSRLLLRARKIRFLLLDVDGILNDGTIWIDDQGREMKGFSIYDGHGIRLLQEAGLEVGLLSGRASNAVALRAKELGIREVHQGVRNKIKVYEELIARHELSDNEVAYMGDDLIDLPILKRVGLSISVPNAVPSVIKSAEWVTRKKGGEGAVREVTDLLLEALRK
ncbi:MAG TPA: HAD hydrolase family protein, partial [Nitrospiria bacterium]|nr:HAD hydrolase family protein [Nitrospiria bacterium]